jgi:transcription antitermination protein NusB
MTAGKRRTAREMAVQMLYQSDLGGSALPHIFNTFDLTEYMARSAAGSPSAKAKDAAAAVAAFTTAQEGGGQPPAGGRRAPAAGDFTPLDLQAAVSALGALHPAEIADLEPEPAPEPAASGAPTAEARADLARQRRRVEDAFVYAQTLVRGTVDHREEIDALIRGQADNWRLERMPAVDRNILRLAIYEMLYESETPKLVVVDEAIELAKKFGSEQSGRFVNGLLDGLLKQRSFPGTLT